MRNWLLIFNFGILLTSSATAQVPQYILELGLRNSNLTLKITGFPEQGRNPQIHWQDGKTYPFTKRADSLRWTANLPPPNDLQIALGALSKSRSEKTVTLWNGHSPLRVNVPGRTIPLPANLPITLSAVDMAAVVQTNERDLPVLPDRSLVITHRYVLDHPTETFDPYSLIKPRGMPRGRSDGAWSFPHILSKLLKQNYNPDTTPEAVKANAKFAKVLSAFAGQWEAKNALGIPADKQFLQEVVQPWRDKSALLQYPSGQLAPHLAPLRLLAIVNRIDLRENFAFGGASGGVPSNAGRLHFVFGFISPDGQALEGRLIVEIRVKKKGEQELWKWARQWQDLTKEWPLKTKIPSENYIRALKKLTEDVLDHSGALSSIRTNEKVDSLTPPWDMREFVLNPQSKVLDSARLTQTPDRKNFSAGQMWLEKFCAGPQADDLIKRGAYRLPDNILAPITSADNEQLKFKAGSESRRHLIALNTCNGCHGPEAKLTVSGIPDDRFFSHISHPGKPGPVTLSDFLMKTDMERRRASLTALLLPSKTLRTLWDLTSAGGSMSGSGH
ncbi:MAG: hypothetical protein V4726_00210 [Verrucomicrobiota bacterium]